VSLLQLKNQDTGNHLRELKSNCERIGYEVAKIYEEKVSGEKTREKGPAYNELCKDALLKKFGIIVGWNASRSRW